MTAPARTGGATNRRRTATVSRGDTQATRRTASERMAGEPKTGHRVEPGGRTRSTAAERAYAKRAQRVGGPVGASRRRPRFTDQPAPARAPFVVLAIGLLTVGVVATLWLSTQAIQDSYRLDRAKKAATDLAERAERLQREVAVLDSAERLAAEAEKAGMVPSGLPVWVVVHPDGTKTLVGEPAPAQPRPAPPAAQEGGG